jgi:hypothetical protein
MASLGLSPEKEKLLSVTSSPRKARISRTEFEDLQENMINIETARRGIAKNAIREKEAVKFFSISLFSYLIKQQVFAKLLLKQCKDKQCHAIFELIKFNFSEYNKSKLSIKA